MKWESRKAYRVRFEHKCTVNLMSVDGTWRRQCLLLDVSQTGARLEVQGSVDVLRVQEFFLVLSSMGLAFRRCELVWIEGTLVGVKFVNVTSRKDRATGQL